MRGRGRGAAVGALGAAAICLAALSGCARESWAPEQVPLERIEVARDRAVVKRGVVGMGKFASEASYVLVPARNPTDRDLIVTLRGALVAGGERHVLRPESIRLPAGGERAFALVTDGQVVVAGEPTAEIVVTGALAVDYAPPVRVGDGHVYQDQGRAVVVAAVKNTGKGEVKTSIVGAFYDADGKPMERPFTVLTLTGGGERNVQLVGPAGSVSAQLYVAEVSY